MDTQGFLIGPSYDTRRMQSIVARGASCAGHYITLWVHSVEVITSMASVTCEKIILAGRHCICK